jgi:syntaxin 8
MYFCSLDTELTPHAPSPSPSGSLIPPPIDSEPVYSPYTDDPEAQSGYDPGIMLQTQKQMMDGKSI